jgi:hypothetical protein
MQQQQNITFLTFGAPIQKYQPVLYRICNEANQSHFFSRIIGISDVQLQVDKQFWDSHGTFIHENPRGFGYWIWKPYIIMQCMKEINYHDILIYADAGCTINPHAEKRFKEYIAMLNEMDDTCGIITFQMEGLPENKYTKSTLLDYMNVSTQDRESGQCQATILLMKKNTHTMNIITQWYSIACQYHLLKDDDEIIDNIQHRHDQSILSILNKQHKSCIIKDETYFQPFGSSTSLLVPFWATRSHFYTNVDQSKQPQQTRIGSRLEFLG